MAATEDSYFENVFVVFYVTKNVHICCRAFVLILEFVARLATLVTGGFLNFHTFNDNRNTFGSLFLGLVAIFWFFGSLTLTCCKVCAGSDEWKKIDLRVRIYEFFFSLIGGWIMLVYGICYLHSTTTSGDQSEDRIKMIGMYGVYCGVSHLVLGSIQCLGCLKFKKRETNTATTVL